MTRRRPKISLRLKLFIALVLVGVPPLIVGLLAAYFEGIDIHEYYTGTRFQNLAHWMSEEIKTNIAIQITAASGLALTPTVIEAVEQANASYKGKEADAISTEISRIDEEWQAASKINDMIRAYLSNRVSQFLQSIMRLNMNWASEIFVTDEHGAIVGATGKTTDFYQADENWWVETFNQGNGRNVVEGVEFDQSAGIESVTVAVPIRDPESNAVIGILKIVIKADYFFRAVSILRMQEEIGYAGLMTPDGTLLASSAPLRPARISEAFWRPILDRGDGWTTVVDETGEKSVLGFAVLDTSDLDAEVRLTGGKWHIFFYRSVREGYSRIYATASRVFSIGFGLVLVLSLLGFYAANWIVMPIRLLREEAQYIAQGDLGRRVEIHTNDEIELLAEEINIMSQKLKETHANLEQRIDERTAQLSEANKKLEAQREVLLKVNKQLMKASTLKSQFLADICDGLNNPVVNIVRLAEVLTQQDSAELNERQKDYLSDILANAVHLRQLINEVFTLAKATSGKIELNLSQFSVANTLHEVHETVRALASEKNVKFDFDLDSSVGEIAADINLFKHVIFNLYTNAIKYNKMNGTVHVTAARVDDSLEVSVTDTGVGIRPEDHERVFHEFERVEDAQEPYYEGAGMGLALARRFVELHGGRIWVESEYGKGSKFVFRIPLKQRG
jgi:signal transduction histidine kinase